MFEIIIKITACVDTLKLKGQLQKPVSELATKDIEKSQYNLMFSISILVVVWVKGCSKQMTMKLSKYHEKPKYDDIITQSIKLVFIL